MNAVNHALKTYSYF